MKIFLIPLNIILPLTLSLAILLFVLGVLAKKNKKLREEIILENKKFEIYKVEIQNIKNSDFADPKKELKNLNKYARNFFKEYYSLDFSLTYLELEKEFEKQKKQDYADFCKSMSEANYSGTKIKSEQVKELIDIFYGFLEKY